jgi:hypothetical protein
VRSREATVTHENHSIGEARMRFTSRQG